MSVKPKKPVKKVAKKTATSARVLPIVSRTKLQDKSEGKAMEQIEELQEENKVLREKVEELEARLENAEAAASVSPAIKWVRGKLPGEKLIKTDPETGKFEEIDRAEWDALA